MKNIVILITALYLVTTGSSSQIVYSQPTMTDLSMTGELKILSGDTQKISLKNNGEAFFDGKLTAKEIEVKPNVWADFVFKKDYKLLSIPELENYIKENNKLPGLPSETQAIKGINLGNVDALLLQKIEELTLYIIRQQKEIEALKNEVEVLKK